MKGKAKKIEDEEFSNALQGIAFLIAVIALIVSFLK